MLRAALVVLLLVLAGCQAPGASVTADSEPGSDAPADPASDRLGWEQGYWHDESLDVTTDDGLNESELDAVVARAMARQEYVRGLEFEERVPVRVINRSTYRNGSAGERDAAFRRFDNGKFEALFLVGERNDSIASQESTRGQSVVGFYSPARDSIVVVSESETPRLSSESTLAHELVHALQDQHFDLGDGAARTRDAYQGRNGLVEGDASFAQRRYETRCGDEWRCLSPDGNGTDGGESGGGGHFGIQYLMYFPYSEGPQFVERLYERGGWAAVDDAYDDVPDGSPEVVYPARYDDWEPADIEVRDRSSGDWERVEPPGRPDYAVLGQSAIASSLAYTLVDDYNRSAVVSPAAVINYRTDGSVDPTDPFDYDVPPAAGWTGGKMYVYQHGAETGYVWKTRWTNASEAREFATAWSAVVEHWGGERVGEREWVVRDGQFADAVRIQRDGDSVTVVNAPERTDLSAVHDG